MPITKVFEIRLTGGGDVVKNIDGIKKSMSALGVEISKTKAELANVLAGNANVETVNVLNAKIKTLEKSLTDLSKQRRIAETDVRTQAQLETALAGSVEKEVNAFAQLNKEYREAKLNAQNMAAQFGVESQQANAAAQAADQYKQKLIEIDRLIKTGGVTPTVDIPLQTNIEGLQTEQEELKKTGDVLSDYDRQQAEAAISAKEFGDSQKVIAKEGKEVSASYIPISGALDQFTGKLRENISVLVANETSLKNNRAQQKEIELAMKSAGGASQNQISQLAALREEELLLVETNKQLNVTIRNQAKEFLASQGSIDEMQAQLNQLQQSFEMLSEAERNSPFGKDLKAQIDILEPRVKEFEASIGKFSRNVGNYPSTFTPAFKILSKELDTIQGKLVKGNFGAKEIDELTRKEAALNNMTAVLGKTFATTAAEQAAYKEVSRQLGAVFGTNSEIFKNFTAQVGVANIEIKKADAQLNAASGAGAKAAGGFQKFYGVLRNIANIIPGIGISGLVLLILAPLESLGAKLVEFANKSRGAKDEAEKLREEYKNMADAVHESSHEFVSAVSTIENLKVNIQLAKEGILDKDEVLKQYNETLGKTTGAVKSLDEAEQAIVKNGNAYIQMMLLKAAAQIALEKAAQKAFEAEETRRKQLEDFRNVAVDRVTAPTGGGAGVLGGGIHIPTPSEIKQQEDEIKRAQQRRKDAELRLLEQQKNDQLDIAKTFQKQAAEIAKNFNFNFFEPDPAKTVKPKADRLSVELQNALKRIEAIRFQQLAIENTYVNEIQKIRDLTFDEEILHIKKVEKINVDALNQKIALFQKRKKLNDEEKKTLAEFIEQRSSIELDSSKKIQAIEKKRYDKQVEDLKNNLDRQIQLIRDNNDLLQNDPSLTQTQKAQAYLDADNKILQIEEQFYKNLLALNSNFNKEALLKAKMGIDAIKKIILNDRKKISEAEIEDIRTAGENQIAEFNIYFARLRKLINENSQLTSKQRKRQLEELDKSQKRTILSAELAQLTIEFKKIEELYNKGLKSKKDYLDAKKKMEEKAAEVEGKLPLDNFVRGIDGFIDSIGRLTKAGDLFEKEIGDTGISVGFVIAQSFDIAKSALSSYYEAKAQAIEQEKQDHLDALDRERERVAARAQSAEEEDTINRQYDKKKRQIEKKAGEQLKKQKLSEARLSLISEIAAIAAAAAANPANAVTFGAAGLAQFGILSALALARYAINAAVINKQQFAHSGKVLPNRGNTSGRLTTAPNIPTQPNGDNVLATVRVGEVWLNEKHQKMLGGPAVFKRIGVPGFATSGQVTAPQLGTNLRPPAFNSGFYSSSINSQNNGTDLTELKQLVGEVASIVYASDKKDVVLNPNRVTKAQTRTRRDVKLGEI